MDRLRGNAAFITGAGSGIGRATARRFAEEGAAVMAADLVEDKAAKTARMITDGGMEASWVGVDVTDGDAVEAALAHAVDDLGGIDVVLNNAGITIVGVAHELPAEDWDRELSINLKSVYLVSRAAWPRLRERGGGCILSTASTAGLWAIPNDAVLRFQCRGHHADQMHGAGRAARASALTASAPASSRLP